MNMRSMKRLGSALVASTALMVAGAASADTTWNWSYFGDGVTASGTFTTAGNALVPEDILSFTGTRNGETILGLVPVGTDDIYEYDNQFTNVDPYFSEPGILFDIGGGTLGSHINIYWDSNDGLIHELQVDPTESFIIDTFVTFSVSAVPEPATYGFMALGLGVVGAVARRRRAA